MNGNAAEWCRDWSAPLPESDLSDYAGPDTGEIRVIKGGSYLLPASSATSEWRDGLPPDATRQDLGFRIIRILPTLQP
jgi:formylglycine-generating enzyme required for sulfatase activity